MQEDLLTELRRRIAEMQRAAPVRPQARARLEVTLSACDSSVPPPEPLDPRLAAALDADGADLVRARIVDTETTGLAGGTGTLAFLIGVGFWEGGVLRVEQLLLRAPGDEAELLARLDRLLAGAGVLVTFNGRSFDVPLLRTRYLMNRMSAAALERPHLDLLPPARRLFRGRALDCRLQTLEWLILHRRRQHAVDVPGAEIPGRYQSYLRTGDPAGLQAVAEHNRRDVVSTAVLLGDLLRRLGQPLEWAEDAWELLAAAQTWSCAGDPTRADAALARGLELARSPPARRCLLRARARLARRRGDGSLARALWERYRDEFPDENLGFVETAKLCEHKLRDLSAALRAAEAAPRPGDELAHRIARLRRRTQALRVH